MKKFRLLKLLLIVMGCFGLLSMTGCEKLKSLTKAKPKVIKGPKYTIQVSGYPSGITMVGAKKALVAKAIKKVSGYKVHSFDYKKGTLVVGYSGDVEGSKFVESMEEFGIKASLQE